MREGKENNRFVKVVIFGGHGRPPPSPPHYHISLQLQVIKHTTGATPNQVRGGYGHQLECNPPTKQSRVHTHAICYLGTNTVTSPTVARPNLSHGCFSDLRLRKVSWVRVPLVSLLIPFASPSPESRELSVFALRTLTFWDYSEGEERGIVFHPRQAWCFLTNTVTCLWRSRSKVFLLYTVV